MQTARLLWHGAVWSYGGDARRDGAGGCGGVGAMVCACGDAVFCCRSLGRSSHVWTAVIHGRRRYFEEAGSSPNAGRVSPCVHGDGEGWCELERCWSAAACRHPDLICAKRYQPSLRTISTLTVNVSMDLGNDSLNHFLSTHVFRTV